MKPRCSPARLQLEDASPTVLAFGTLANRQRTRLDSPAGLSLRAGGGPIPLQDAVATRAKLLTRTDPRYGTISHKLGVWVLVAMFRLAAELRLARADGQFAVGASHAS
jgi:hypothetical protein